MATVRAQGARRLGVIIGIVLVVGVITAVVRSGNNSPSRSVTAQAPVTTTTIVFAPTTVATTAPAPTPTSTPATAAGGAATPAGGGLVTSGPGAAATPQHPTTGGPLPL